MVAWARYREPAGCAAQAPSPGLRIHAGGWMGNETTARQCASLCLSKKKDLLLVFSGCSHHSLCMHTDASTTRPISQEASTWSDADSHMVAQPRQRAGGCWVPEAI